MSIPLTADEQAARAVSKAVQWATGLDAHVDLIVDGTGVRHVLRELITAVRALQQKQREQLRVAGIYHRMPNGVLMSRRIVKMLPAEHGWSIEVD